MIERLKKEAEIMIKLNHKNIVKFIEFHYDGLLRDEEENLIEDEIAYGSLEYITNGEIFDILFETGAFEENTFKYYSKQLIDVIHYLHKNNLVHRDLKPENILIGDDFEVKLADFGFSTEVKENEKNKTHLGTGRYMCPELVMKKKYDAKKADVFALGVIMFVFVKGSPPFEVADYHRDPYYKTLLTNPRKYWKVMD